MADDFVRKGEKNTIFYLKSLIRNPKCFFHNIVDDYVIKQL